jgi:hypothetical protein
MKRFVALALVAISLVALPGCGGPDAVMKELVANLNRWAEVVKKGESIERQQAAADRVRNTLEKLDRMKLSPEEREKLFAKYEAELNEAGERLDDAMAQQAAAGGPVAFPNFSGWKTPKRHMKELVKDLNAWADVVEKKESEEEQKKVAERVQATVDQLEKLKANPEDREKLYKESEDDLNKATERLKKGVEALQKEGKPVVVPNYSWQKKGKPKT